MKISQYYPVLQTADVARLKAFYCDTLDFDVKFDADWYVHLQSRHSESVNLAILLADHETVPEDYRQPAQGVILNFEVEDVDALNQRMLDANVQVVRTLRDEAFGQRHVIVRDPDGNLIDLIKIIPPSAEFAAQYSDDALPT